MDNTERKLWASRILGIAYLLLLLFLFLLWGRSRTYLEMPLTEYIKLFTNYVPCKTTIEQIKLMNAGLINRNIVFSNTIAHVLVFIPLGMIMAIAWKQKWRLHLVFAGTVSLTIELLQLLLRIGSFDVDAALLNVLGYFIGFWAMHGIINRFKRKDDYNVQKNTQHNS